MAQENQKTSISEQIAESFFAEFQRSVSRDRFAQYRRAEPGKVDAIALYLWNMSLAEALYPALHCVEVSLRNAVHRALSHQMKTSSWYNDHVLLLQRQVSQVEAAQNELDRQHKTLEPSRIVAELNFGFWVNLYSRPYLRTIVLPTRHSVFPSASKRDLSPGNLSAKLQQIRDIRNRVFHHESIWQWPNLDGQHQNMIEVIGWISPVKRELVEAVNRYDVVKTKGLEHYRDHVNILIAQRCEAAKK